MIFLVFVLVDKTDHIAFVALVEVVTKVPEEFHSSTLYYAGTCDVC